MGIMQALGRIANNGRPTADEDSVRYYAPQALTLDPRPYQAQWIQWARERKRVICADAPGLGKTLQASEAAELPCVVSCPLNLVEQWREFLETQYPMTNVVVAAYGDVIERTAQLQKPFDWLIVNHDMWRKFFIPDAQTLIIDEMHHFRNNEAQRAVWLRAYAHRTPMVLGLTATPVYKDAGDLWHLLHILDKETWRSHGGFIGKYLVTSDYGYGTKVIRVRNQRKLDEDIRPYIWGRTYKEVGLYLPDRIEKDVILRMGDADMKRYKKLRDYYVLEMEAQEDNRRFTNAGAVLHELRRMTLTKQKLETVKEIIDDTPGTEPIIVFCWYKDTARKVAEFVDGVCITGDEDAADRRHLARTGGEEGKRARVVTMAALSEGVDVSAARTVIYVEEDYAPGMMYQSVTRVVRHRTEGGTDPVIIYSVRYAQTVDETVHKASKSRAAGNALTVVKEALGIE